MQTQMQTDAQAFELIRHMIQKTNGRLNSVFDELKCSELYADAGPLIRQGFDEEAVERAREVIKDLTFGK